MAMKFILVKQKGSKNSYKRVKLTKDFTYPLVFVRKPVLKDKCFFE